MKQKIKREQLFPKKKLVPVVLMAMMGGLGICRLWLGGHNTAGYHHSISGV